MTKPRFGDSIRDPYEQQKFRRFYMAFIVVFIGYNLFAIVRGLIAESPIWWLNLVAVILVLGVGIFLTRAWDYSDADQRERVAKVSHHPTTVPVTLPEDADSPFTYAMMRAFHSGEPVSVYRDDDGVWRDSVTDEPTPVQEAAKWICGKCAREIARGFDDGQIPEHHSTCPKWEVTP